MNVKLPLAKPEIIDTLTSWTPLSYKFNQAVDSLFWWCVELLKVWGDVTGLGYNLLNILVFILLQPALILLFFTLWIYEKNKRRGVHYG